MAPTGVVESWTMGMNEWTMMLAVSVLISLSLVLLVLYCACCRKQDDTKRVEVQLPQSGPEMVKNDTPIETPSANRAPPVILEEKPKSSISAKKEPAATTKTPALKPKSNPKIPTVPKKSSTAPSALKAPIKASTTATTDSDKKSLRDTSQINMMASVVTPSAMGGIPLANKSAASGEPTYPASEAADYENPAYDTIGPEFEDPFKGFSGPTPPEPPLVVAELVEPSKNSSSKDRSARAQLKSLNKPASVTPSLTGSTVESKSMVQSVSRAPSVAKTALAPASTRALK